MHFSRPFPAEAFSPVASVPGYQNVNLALLKQVPLSSRARLQLRAEVFNLLNRANFDLPDNFFGSPTFGQILSAQSPRHIQFGARLMF